MTTVVEAPTSTEAGVFRRAADIIEEWGWCQRAVFKSKYGVHDETWGVDDYRIANYCAMGAVWRAAWERGIAPRSWQELCDLVGDDQDPYIPIYQATGMDADEVMALISFNDDERTSAGLVTGVLRAKAVEAESYILNGG